MDVEIWSDIACPWCYIGKRRFEAALASFEHRDEVRVTWRSFELDPHAPRERSGDRAAHLAEKYGTSREQAEEMQRHMTEGELIADPAALEPLALEVGLSRDDVREVLAGDRYSGEVRADERTATSLGISAVPFFVVDRSLGASGAQPPDVLAELLRRARAAQPLSPVSATGESCTVDGC